MNGYKRKDLLLVTYFRNNARENLTRISRMTSIPVSTIFDKLREYERGLIRKHTTIVDFKKLGFDIRITLLFKVARDAKSAFKDFLMEHDNVNSVFRVSNGFDYVVDAVFRNMDDLQDFMAAVDSFNIEDKQELFVIEDIKREEFLSDRGRADALFG